MVMTYKIFRFKFPADIGENRISLLDEEQRISNKMKFHKLKNGTLFVRVKSNQCHQFHSTDRIDFGLKKEDIKKVVMKIYLSIENNKNKAIKACDDHVRRLKNEVLYPPILSNLNNFFRTLCHSSCSKRIQ